MQRNDMLKGHWCRLQFKKDRIFCLDLVQRTETGLVAPLLKYPALNAHLNTRVHTHAHAHTHTAKEKSFSLRHNSTLETFRRQCSHTSIAFIAVEAVATSPSHLTCDAGLMINDARSLSKTTQGQNNLKRLQTPHTY